MRISDWSSDVCSSDLTAAEIARGNVATAAGVNQNTAGTVAEIGNLLKGATTTTSQQSLEEQIAALVGSQTGNVRTSENVAGTSTQNTATNQLIQEIINAISQTNTTKRTEEHTSELQSLMRNSSAVSCMNKKTTNNNNTV